MIINFRLFRLLLTIIIILLVTSCTDKTTQTHVIESSPTPSLNSNTVVIPTPSPSPQPTDIPIEIIFDGRNCAGALPEKIPVGVHSFILLDQTEYQAELWLIRLTDGKTFQDLLDMQDTPGEWDPKPRWAKYDTQLSREILETKDLRLESTSWKFYLVGEHVVYCYVPSPQMIFYAGPIMIVDSMSD